MSGPQFANIQTYSLKENKAGNSISQVVAEAMRDEEFSLHVDAPQPPRLLLGNASTFADDHAAHVAARQTIVTMANGTERTKAIRKDRHTMASIVVSYPVPHSAINDDEAKAKLARWETRNVAWLQEKYGTQLRVVLAHDDEDHPHLHAWLLPDNNDADAKALHPGKAAKIRVEQAAKADGIKPEIAVKMGNQEYRSVMKTWQDEYHAAVGISEGLTRTGPKRQRLSRNQWRSQKDAAKAAQAALERADAADIRARDAEARLAVVEERERKTQAEAAILTKVHGSVMRDKKNLSEREAAVSAREQAVDAKERQSDIKAAQIIEAAHTEAQEVREDAEVLRAETNAACLMMVDQADGERRQAGQFMKMVRDMVGRIGSAFGLDLLGKDIMRDIEAIEDALVAAEKPGPEADSDGPGF